MPEWLSPHAWTHGCPLSPGLSLLWVSVISLGLVFLLLHTALWAATCRGFVESFRRSAADGLPSQPGPVVLAGRVIASEPPLVLEVAEGDPERAVARRLVRGSPFELAVDGGGRVRVEADEHALLIDALDGEPRPAGTRRARRAELEPGERAWVLGELRPGATSGRAGVQGYRAPASGPVLTRPRRGQLLVATASGLGELQQHTAEKAAFYRSWAIRFGLALLVVVPGLFGHYLLLATAGRIVTTEQIRVDGNVAHDRVQAEVKRGDRRVRLSGPICASTHEHLGPWPGEPAFRPGDRVRLARPLGPVEAVVVRALKGAWKWELRLPHTGGVVVDYAHAMEPAVARPPFGGSTDLRVTLKTGDRVRVRHDGLWWRATVVTPMRRYATVSIDGFERPVTVPARHLERGTQPEPEGRSIAFRCVPFWPAVHQLGAEPALRSGPAVAALALTLLLLGGYLVGSRRVERRRPEDALHAATAAARTSSR